MSGVFHKELINQHPHAYSEFFQLEDKFQASLMYC